MKNALFVIIYIEIEVDGKWDVSVCLLSYAYLTVRYARIFGVSHLVKSLWFLSKSSDTGIPRILPFHKMHAPHVVALANYTGVEKITSKKMLVLHAKTFEMTKPSIMQVIILK